MSSETAKLQAADGHTLDAYVASPEGTPKAAVVILQEIYGVNHHIRSVADRYAAEGYLAIAPALFDRYERGFEAEYTSEGSQRGMAIYGQLDFDLAVADTRAAVEYARDEYKTKVGVVGFCLGGSLAWVAAAELPVSAAVGYYGGLIAERNELQPQAPVMLHFGLQDDHIPQTGVEAIRVAHPAVPVYLYEAGHGFNCDERGSYNEAAANEARARTMAFLDEHLGGAIDNSGKAGL
ncbi:dienelactone hydrolase family protein [Acidipila sp. EB88]|uniref:dienelactone hydrolase family protein n=1 Tax=Acidipila sp. EB88 TaxID=2305226 RepID=UPI000F5DA8B8|nr:dienelactone hydrolase family protein [Acidipila sp. EB88]RRA47228.1 dienelactone hydrolase family protein [Acidipila sp. EB88]